MNAFPGICTSSGSSQVPSNAESPWISTAVPPSRPSRQSREDTLQEKLSERQRAQSVSSEGGTTPLTPNLVLLFTKVNPGWLPRPWHGAGLGMF